MKLRTSLLLCLCSVLLIGILSSCRSDGGKETSYTDTNKIVQEGDSFTFKSRNDSEEANHKTNTKYSGFSGTDTIWTVEATKNINLTVNYESTVTHGDFKVVLISPDKKITTVLTGNQQGHKKINVNKGTYRIKIVGRKAYGKINFSINKQKHLKISKIRMDF
ncbi:hypothetical protein NIE88_05550 [Sporolactobacillus shoreicorticis]|uniref:Lipoprotein n=1 Tax=Sporolactobacillus shoreicorticis TaxID=1923877 RepID=A0ABW5S1P9_9BACL|nr:hypothetical protein [Sporolactobacillus shoreicorticis]MCO7125237.1 hypothetical protein [Sporolactobacillus shoreicorticis]